VAGELGDLMNSSLELVRGDLVRVLELDTGVSLPNTELGLAEELGDSLISSLEPVMDEPDLQKSPRIFHGFLCDPNILSRLPPRSASSAQTPATPPPSAHLVLIKILVVHVVNNSFWRGSSEDDSEADDKLLPVPLPRYGLEHYIDTLKYS
jgi:hypothetical protein